MRYSWHYEQGKPYRYGGDDTTYKAGMEFCAEAQGIIEDWGCGAAWAKQFAPDRAYRGIDGHGDVADIVCDLALYQSHDAGSIFMRHVLEHAPAPAWEQILDNAVKTFQHRMALIIFTPFGDKTHVIDVNQNGSPDISFREDALTCRFSSIPYTTQHYLTVTKYGTETIYFLDKGPPTAAWRC